MNSMEGSQTIPAYVEYENALVFGSRHLFRMVRLTFNRLTAMVPYMEPLYFWALCEVNKFSNFCPLSTFDS